jgi:hypothetical protein
LFATSNAVTVKLNAVPAVVFAGAETKKCVAGPALTLIVAEVPVIEALTVSIAEMACGPVVLSVAEKFPTPLVRVELPGSTAATSVLMKCTVPV